MNEKKQLREVEQVEITSLVDNVVDILLESSENVKRAPRIRGSAPAPPLLAEHGFAAFVRVTDGNHTHAILLDAGMSERTMLVNAERLEVDLGEIETVVISHGHVDHIQALMPALGRLRPGVPIVIHPHAFSRRVMKLPNGTHVRLTPLDADALERAGARVIRRKESSLLGDGTILVTGEVPRITAFEFGLPIQYAIVGGVEQPDPLTPDDQALVVAVREKGLVVISGCGHAGIVNTVSYARRLAGSQRVHAIIGGFHLAGPLYESVIDPTVAAIEEIAPDFVVPAHCTGWKATHEFARRMPHAFVQNSVGTRLIFRSSQNVQC